MAVDNRADAAQSAASTEATAARLAMKRITLRIMPLLIAAYFIAYLDRVNLSFAAIQMNADLGFSSAAYGLGAGLFFLSYCLFEIPSNLIMQRVGPIRWIARIMVSWGLVSAGMAFVTNEWNFYAMRLLLGAAEAGFFPGVLYFVSLWFPARYRGRVLGIFFAAVPVSGIIGAPLSGYLLTFDGLAGLNGWQWLFIIEGIPAVLLAPVLLMLLQDKPAQAKWLPPEEKAWLEATLIAEKSPASAKRAFSWTVLVSPLVLACGAIYFTDTSLLNGITFFLPQVVRSFGLTELETGFVVAIPSFVCLATIIWWGRRADIVGDHCGSAAIALGIGGAALLASETGLHPIVRMVAISLAFSATVSFAPTFWAFVSTLFDKHARAAGLAAVSSLGVSGGFFAPFFVGYLKDLTGEFRIGLSAIGAVALIAALCLWLLGQSRAKPVIE